MEHSISKCPVCEAISWRLVFQEKIRDGLFGQYTTDDARIVECESCSLQKLDFFVLTPEKYESDEYRIKYNGTKEETDLLALHDAEQANRLAVIQNSYRFLFVLRAKTQATPKQMCQQKARCIARQLTCTNSARASAESHQSGLRRVLCID